VTGFLFLATGFFALAAFALRDFSWNRIDDIAKRRKVEHRFGDILEQHLEAQLAVEIALCLSFGGLLGLLFFQADFSAFRPNDPLTWLDVGGTLLQWSLILVVWVIVLPRTWSRVSGERVLVRAWPILRLVRKVLSPALWIFGKFDRLVHRLAGIAEPETGMLLTLTQEILSVVDEGANAKD
jgi:CBS domain containing-hemolysin-like protein